VRFCFSRRRVRRVVFCSTRSSWIVPLYPTCNEFPFPVYPRARVAWPGRVRPFPVSSPPSHHRRLATACRINARWTVRSCRGERLRLKGLSPRMPFGPGLAILLSNAHFASSSTVAAHGCGPRRLPRQGAWPVSAILPLARAFASSRRAHQLRFPFGEKNKHKAGKKKKKKQLSGIKHGKSQEKLGGRR